MNSTVDEFVASLVGVRDWNPQFAQMSEWAAAGRTDDLLAVGDALTDTARTPAI